MSLLMAGQVEVEALPLATPPHQLRGAVWGPLHIQGLSASPERDATVVHTAGSCWELQPWDLVCRRQRCGHTPESNAAQTAADASPACHSPVRPFTRNFGAAAGFAAAGLGRMETDAVFVFCLCLGLPMHETDSLYWEMKLTDAHRMAKFCRVQICLCPTFASMPAAVEDRENHQPTRAGCREGQTRGSPAGEAATKRLPAAGPAAQGPLSRHCSRSAAPGATVHVQGVCSCKGELLSILSKVHCKPNPTYCARPSWLSLEQGSKSKTVVGEAVGSMSKEAVGSTSKDACW